jgi:hypothetical protein
MGAVRAILLAASIGSFALGAVGGQTARYEPPTPRLR